MHVFRLGLAGREGGDPQRPLSADDARDLRIPDFAEIPQKPLDESGNPEPFLISELFEHGRLRQGWGVPGLDLAKPEIDWISAYVRASWVYWAQRTRPEQAKGRYAILIAMYNFSPDEILFIPNASSRGYDPSRFTVATVTTRESARVPYYFDEERERSPMHDWTKDFGHVIPVERVREYSKARYSLDFGAPFLSAITPIDIRSERGRPFLEFRKLYMRD